MATDLTIGIPTYQRRDAITQTVRSLLESELPPNVNILVVDDGSTDGTFEMIDQLTANPAVRVVRNEQNTGFVGAFSRLFDECASDYLVVTSDEDEIQTEHLPSLLNLCSAARPLLVSAQAIVNGTMLRGQPVQRSIRAQEWRFSTNYISGTVYEVDTSRPFVHAIRQLAADNGAAEVYPQVLLAAELLLRGDGVWLAAPLTVKRDSLPTHITDKKHGAYWFVPARWSQYLEVEEYLSKLASASTSNTQRDRARAMLELHRAGLYRILREAIGEQRPDLLTIFDTEARRSRQPRIVQRAIAAAHDPGRALSVLRERAKSVWANR